MRFRLRRTTQRAGASSKQMQAGNNLTVVENAQIVLDETLARALAANFTEAARATGQRRSEQLNGRVREVLSREGLLPVLGEPDFQALLTKAQIGAAQTDDELDYMVLTNMLADRARQGNVRSRRIGLDRAIEVVDKVDPIGLKALTCLFLYARVMPAAGLIKPGLEAHDALYGSVLGDDDLSAFPSVLDHLDLLNLVRINTLGGFRNFADYWMHKVPGWQASGLPVGPDTDEVWQGFARRGLGPAEAKITRHEFDGQAFRLAYVSPAQFRQSLDSLGRYSEAQIDEILAYARTHFGLADDLRPHAPALSSLIDTMPNLSRFRTWVEAQTRSCSFTSAGLIMAKAFAEQCGIADKITGWEQMDLQQ